MQGFLRVCFEVSLAHTTVSVAASLTFTLSQSRQHSICKLQIHLDIRYLATHQYSPAIRIFQFVDDLPFTNWERFEIHARRVRILYMETPCVAISPIIYLRIRGMCDRPLLPGLKAIYMPDNNNAIDFASVMLLAIETSLNVVELNHSAISEEHFFIPFLTLLATKSPQLRRLALRGAGNISLEHVFCFTNLQHLEIRLSGTYLYPQTLQRFGKLLDLTLDISTSDSAPLDTQLPIPFPSSHGSLRRLHVIGIPSSIARVLTDILCLANLTSLVIDEKLVRTTVHPKIFWVRCFEQVSLYQAIEDIEINQCDHDKGDYFLSNSWFNPLLNLKNVKSLVINGPKLSGSDEDFCRLACSFPKLQKLVVPPDYHSQGPTLACLSYFGQECPDLREIRICLAFDIDENLDAMQELPDTIRVNHRHPLEKLYIASEFDEIELSHMIQVARFLDLHFPNLSILKFYESEIFQSGKYEASNWEEIQQIRVALRAARIDTIHRARSEMESEK